MAQLIRLFVAFTGRHVYEWIYCANKRNKLNITSAVLRARLQMISGSIRHIYIYALFEGPAIYPVNNCWLVLLATRQVETSLPSEPLFSNRLHHKRPIGLALIKLPTLHLLNACERARVHTYGSLYFKYLMSLCGSGNGGQCGK